MQPLFLLWTAVGLASAQSIDLSSVRATPPVLVTPAVNVVAQTATYSPVPTFSTTESSDAAATTIALTPPQKRRRRQYLAERDGDCSPNPVPGYGPVPTPDTPDAFVEDQALQAMAKEAAVPEGYNATFINLNGSVTASMYMGLWTMNYYEADYCASLCNQNSGCVAFNVYLERDPSVIPNSQKCPNPPSKTVYKCTLWGAPIAAQEATNTGQWQDKFQIVVTGSNGYNKISEPFISNWTGPTAFSGAIDAPIGSNGYTTSTGSQYIPFSQAAGYDPTICAQTCYDMNSPSQGATCGVPRCTFFNSFVISSNGIPQGMYCSFYNATWTAAEGTNTGATENGEQYTYSQSVGYALHVVDNCDLVADPYFAVAVADQLPPHYGAWTGESYGLDVNKTLFPKRNCYNNTDPHSGTDQVEDSCMSLVYPSCCYLAGVNTEVTPVLGGQTYILFFDYRVESADPETRCNMDLSFGLYGLDIWLRQGGWKTFSSGSVLWPGDGGSKLDFGVQCYGAATVDISAVHVYLIANP